MAKGKGQLVGEFIDKLERAHYSYLQETSFLQPKKLFRGTNDAMVREVMIDGKIFTLTFAEK